MTILLFFIETKIGRTIAISFFVIIGMLIGWLSFKTYYYNQGFAAALHAIAAQDKRAVDAKNKALEEVRGCRDRGGTWNVSDGMCE